MIGFMARPLLPTSLPIAACPDSATVHSPRPSGLQSRGVLALLQTGVVRGSYTSLAHAAHHGHVGQLYWADKFTTVKPPGWSWLFRTSSASSTEDWCGSRLRRLSRRWQAADPHGRIHVVARPGCFSAGPGNTTGFRIAPSAESRLRTAAESRCSASVSTLPRFSSAIATWFCPPPLRVRSSPPYRSAERRRAIPAWRGRGGSGSTLVPASHRRRVGTTRGQCSCHHCATRTQSPATFDLVNLLLDGAATVSATTWASARV